MVKLVVKAVKIASKIALALVNYLDLVSSWICLINISRSPNLARFLH